MKNLFILTIIGLSVFAVQSCKKSYACECTGETTDLNYGKVDKDEVDALQVECESDTTAVCSFIEK